MNRDYELSLECAERATNFADASCCGGVSAVWNPSNQPWASWFILRDQHQIFYAVFMIPVGWLLAYICVRLARWVRSGLPSRSESRAIAEPSRASLVSGNAC
jgi:hypothetical protein